MKKAIIVQFSFMTRIVIDENEEYAESIVDKAKPKILLKVQDELIENLSDWHHDDEQPYDKDVD